MAALDLDVFASAQRLLLDFLKEASAADTTHLDPAEFGRASTLKQSWVDGHGHSVGKETKCSLFAYDS